LGTGTGAIALGLATHYPSSHVKALDLSADAAALAAENVAATGLAERVTVLVSDWFAVIDPAERFDLIEANPPYLSVEETEVAAPEVRDHEPKMALTPGDDGFGALAQIVSRARAFLRPGGMLAMETGIAQHEQLARRLAAGGYQQIELLADLPGRPRFVFARA
jgi:release factor glutamine methyltransferase